MTTYTNSTPAQAKHRSCDCCDGAGRVTGGTARTFRQRLDDVRRVCEGRVAS